MIYYYICDDCGVVKELPFIPDQDLVYCENLEHEGYSPAMRIVVPEDNIIIEPPTLEKIPEGGWVRLRTTIATFFWGILSIMFFCLLCIVSLVMIKILIEVWKWVF